MIAEAGCFGGAGTGFLAHQGVELERQGAFDVVRITGVQFLGDDQAEDAVAEKFETLVGDDRVGAGMGQGALEQIPVGEDMAEPFFEVSR
jgi:hypothetical protein